MNQSRGVHDPAAYLCVDRYIRTSIDARAIQTAFELGLVDRLRDGATRSLVELQSISGVDAGGLRILIDLLRSNGVVEESANGIGLTEPFRAALAYQDLLLAKIQFAELVAPDFHERFTLLLRDPQRFMREARLFKLFDYRRCIEYSPENEQFTRRWMGFTTALTRHEAGVCLHYFDFSPHQRLLDVGGNSGEFGFQVCRKHQHVHATVLDLPLVCRIGRQHVSAHPEAQRIRFVEGDALAGAVPGGMDLISFKSMLHDWPDDHARQLIAKATAALAPGGTLLIFERGRLDIPRSGIPWSLVPMLLFFRSFREPSFYEDYLRQLGYQDVQSRQIPLETAFVLVTARKAK